MVIGRLNERWLFSFEDGFRLLVETSQVLAVNIFIVHSTFGKDALASLLLYSIHGPNVRRGIYIKPDGHEDIS